MYEEIMRYVQAGRDCAVHLSPKTVGSCLVTATYLQPIITIAMQMLTCQY